MSFPRSPIVSSQQPLACESPDVEGARLSARLQRRRAEIGQALLARVEGVPAGIGEPDAEYREGLRAAVRSALDHGIDALERSDDRPAPVPIPLLAQARLAARNGIHLDVVLRRYVAGFNLLSDFIVREAEGDTSLRQGDLNRMLRSEAAILDRLVVAVSEEHGRERQGKPGSTEQRRVLKVKQLLAGELTDTSELDYNFEGFHLGVIGSGPEASRILKGLIAPLKGRLLLIRLPEGVVWGWCASRRPIEPPQVEGLASGSVPAEVTVAIGEPGEGLTGWRLTHRQAQATWLVARRRHGGLARYADVALVTSILHDDLLATSLRQLYLAPLSADRDGGELAQETLTAYFAAGRNISSAAAMLGISRQAVGSRLRRIERRIGRPLNACAPEVEAALRLNVHDRYGNALR